MTERDGYIYEFDDLSPTRIAGRIHHRSIIQPVELNFLADDVLLFSIVANVAHDEFEPKYSSFDLAIHGNIWQLTRSIRIHTVDGVELAIVERPAIFVRRKNSGDIKHEFTSTDLTEIYGLFEFEEEVETRHGVKLFSDGKLEAYTIAQSLGGASGGVTQEDAFDIPWRRYAYGFEAATDGRLFSRIVFVTIDDRFVYATGAHRITYLKSDPDLCGIPLPMKLESIIKTTTKTNTEVVEPVALYDLGRYFGEGTGSLLLFDKMSDFSVEIEQGKFITEIRYADDDLFIGQHFIG